MTNGRKHFMLKGGWCHIVALLAVTAWVLTVAICPEVPEAFGAATQQTIHRGEASNTTGGVDLHTSCDHAAHASVTQRFAKMIRGRGTIAGSPLPGPAIPKFAVAAPPPPVMKTARTIDDRPRMHSARFAGFWPHAPPLTL